MKNGLRPSLPVLLAVLALSPAAVAASPRLPSRATKHGGQTAAHLDRSFGNAGRVTLPTPTEGAQSAVLMHDDGLVLNSGKSLMRLTPRGQLDAAFGEGGTVTPSAPPGRNFEIAGLAVDAHDRILVAGTVVGPAEDPPPPFGNGNTELPKAARVVRYLPNGVLDPTFGSEGVVETDFGLPAPRNRTGEQILPKPWVVVTGVAVDAEDRVVLTGGASVGLEYSCFHDWSFNTLTYAAFAVRLTEAGTLDTGFGSAGVFGGHSTSENPLHAEVSANPMIRPGGEVVYSSGRGPCPNKEGSDGLAEISADGEARASFGTGGAFKQPYYAAAVDPAGSITTLGLAGTWYFSKEPARILVTRLHPNGRPDRSYGNRGHAVTVTPGGPDGDLYTLATDASGRTLLGGTMVSAKLSPGPTPQAKKRHRRLFVLVRLDRRGRLDRAFGPRGRIATRFGDLAVWESSLLLDSKGRAVMVGTYKGPGQGLVVARYMIDNRGL